MNFYEFLAAAVLRDDVDEDLLIETLRTKFLKFFEQNQDYIGYWQRDGGTTGIHLTDMYHRWSRLSVQTRR